jgi:hypothetical protein
VVRKEAGVESRLNEVMRERIQPMKRETLKNDNPWLYEKLEERK